MRTTNGIRWPLEEEAADSMAGGGGGDNKPPVKDDGLGTMEDRARRMGWTDKDTFRGAPEKWTDAATFVKNGEESLPILRERLRSSERARAELEKSVGDARKHNDTIFERAYEKAKKELKAGVKAAAKAGDEVAAAAASEELATLERQKVEHEAAAKADPVFDGWVADNAWYNDPKLQKKAEVEAFRLRHEEGLTINGLDFLERVKAAMKEKYPEAFGNPRRQAPNTTERPGAGGEVGNGGKKGWDQMPRDAKDAGERFIKQKLVKDKATYAAQYWAQEA